MNILHLKYQAVNNAIRLGRINTLFAATSNVSFGSCQDQKKKALCNKYSRIKDTFLLDS